MEPIGPIEEEEEENDEVLTTSEVKQEKKKDPRRYEEIFVGSFTQAVEKIEKDTVFNDNEFNFCLLDIDGVLFEDNRVKLPILSHKVEPEITQENRDSFNRLLSITGDRLAISTNRSENETHIFNSKRVLEEVEDMVNSSSHKALLFTGLFKQIPGLTVENISDIHRDNDLELENWSEFKVMKPRIDALVQYIGKLATEKEYPKYNLTSIEDWSVASLNRRTFLRYVTRRLRKEYAIDIRNIQNFVIQR